MLKISNYGPVKFREYINNKRVFVWGAGRALKSCLELYFQNINIAGIIDNNPELHGSVLVHNSMELSIMDENDFVKEIHRSGKKNTILMVNSPFYAPEIIEKLDRIAELDDLETFLQIIVSNTQEKDERFEFTQGEQKIPKILHCIWIGGKAMPVEFRKNIETWKKFNKDYEIIEWNENNYDFTKNRFLQEAYENKAWAFATNYMRLDLVNKYGGIYLDTDVEVIHNMDILLNDEAFFGMARADRIANGVGFGAVKGHPLIRQLLDEYKESRFLDENGKPIRKANHTIVHPAMKKWGFNLVNRYQKIDGVVLYPTEVFAPKSIDGLPENYTENTISVHKESGSWKNEKEQSGYDRLKDFIQTRLTQ